MESKRGVKRVRGWQLEKEQQEGPCPKDLPAEEDCNPLCTKLIELWSQGKLSASQVAEVSHLAFLNGAESAEIMDLAKCGTFGESQGNCHRDLLSLCCKHMQLPDPHLIKVPVKDPKTQKPGFADMAILLPHMIFSFLSENYEDSFGDIFAIKDCKQFWEGVEGCKDPRIVNPIGSKNKVYSPHTTVPLFTHADGVEYQVRDSLMCWSWGALVSKNPSLSAHLLIGAIPKSCTLPSTWEALDLWISWSFSALTKGKHPEKDPWGKPLTKGQMAQFCGQPLTKGGHRGVIWSIQEYYSNVLRLPHWQNQFPCFMCDTQRPMFKKVKCPEGKSFKILKEDEQTFKDTDPSQWFLDKRSTHPLFTVPWVSTALVRGDSLHILFVRGVANHLAGSLIFYLCFYDWPQRQKVAPAQRLATIFGKIKQIYTESQVPVRITNMRLSMLCDINKPHKGYPVLDCKASECKHVLPCLESLLREVLDPDARPVHSKMIGCIQALNQIIQHFDQVDVFLTPKQYKTSRDLAKRFFGLYQDLHSWALTKGQKLFHITSKFHACGHLFKNTKWMNYRIHQNFRAEHFVGQMSQLAHSCSFGVKNTRISLKVVEKYKVLLHLQLTRPGFGFLLDDKDP